MNKLPLTVLLAGVVIAIVILGALHGIVMPGSAPSKDRATAGSTGMVPAAELLRVPVSRIYPGGTTTGLNAEMENPLAKDPDAVQRGMKDFEQFNCSGCHMPNGGGGMGPALSNLKWIYGKSPGHVYLDIAQGREAGMPAWGGMLPDRTIWELTAYVESLAQKPPEGFGTTTSAAPQTPATEQVPAEHIETATPWNYTEPMPENGEKPGQKPGEQQPAKPPGE